MLSLVGLFRYQIATPYGLAFTNGCVGLIVERGQLSSRDKDVRLPFKEQALLSFNKPESQAALGSFWSRGTLAHG
jgi:hypothetical protein